MSHVFYLLLDALVFVPIRRSAPFITPFTRNGQGVDFEIAGDFVNVDGIDIAGGSEGAYSIPPGD